MQHGFCAEMTLHEKKSINKREREERKCALKFLILIELFFVKFFPIFKKQKKTLRNWGTEKKIRKFEKKKFF